MERVTTGSKGRGEIKCEAGEFSGVVTNAPTTESLEKRYGAFSGCRMVVRKIEVLLVDSWLDVDRSEEAMLVNMCVSIKKVTREGKMTQVNWTGYQLLRHSRKRRES